MDTASQVPVCLIENVKGQLIPNQKALEILSEITQPVVVVAIVGLYRTGKSYLMNKLAGKKTGFSLGSTIQSHTKGIWMWCIPHPQKPDHTIVLLDTEGLGDVEKGDNQNDCWIFALAILLSNTFVYNSMGAINQQAMDQLHYVTELTDQIRARASTDQEDEVEDSSKFVSFFPDFVWVLRDMTLRLEADGQSLTADEYLENSLKLKPGTSEVDKNYNLPRLCIRKFFPKKKCFVFYPPTEWKKISELENLNDDELDSDFVQQVAEFCSFIFSSSRAKALPGGIKVNGAQLGILAHAYLDAIKSGKVPCLENAVNTLAERENSIALQKATDHYTEQMDQQVRLPTDTLQELLDIHAVCEKKAIAVFMGRSFKDDQMKFQAKLMATVEERKEDFIRQNEAASLSYCQAELEKLAEPLRESISRGDFSVPGGHSLYLEARKKVEQGYEHVPRKGVKVGLSELTTDLSAQRPRGSNGEEDDGDCDDEDGVEGVLDKETHMDLQKKLDKFIQSEAIIQIRKEYIVQICRGHICEDIQMTHCGSLLKKAKASEVFQTFLKSLTTMEASILQSDKALTDGQRAMAAEQARKEAAEKELDLMRQHQKEQEEAREAYMITVSENMAQLQRKMEMERENLLKEQERVLDHKLKEIEKLYQERAGKELDDLKVEINRVTGQMDAIKQNSFDEILSMLCEILVNVFSSEIKKLLKHW